MKIMKAKPIDVLLVEDNLGDVRLIKEALQEGKFLNNLVVVKDGEAALKYLRKEAGYKKVITPDLIILDLNLPKKDGREVLETIKSDEKLKRIPVVVLTTSRSEIDILASYNLHANSYITKPVDLERFIDVIRGIENYWMTIVKLPPKMDN